MSQKSRPPQTQISKVFTQVVQHLPFSKSQKTFKLKPGAQVPELRIEGQSKPFKLLGDRYLVGRSSQCDIALPKDNSIIGRNHCSLVRHPRRPRNFYIRDENSKNGIYFGKRRFSKLTLRHGDVISLGPPDLADAIALYYHNPQPLWIRMVRWGLWGSGALLAMATVGLGWQWKNYPVNPIPTGVNGPVVIYAGDGQTPLNPVRNDRHQELTRLKDFSPYLPQAVVASEDSRYYWHFGVDPLGIARAILANLRGKREGASTITQQVARSLFSQVGQDNTASRKIREMIVAMKLETFYSKDEILKLYLNRVYLGVGSYGFEDAAQFYFDKSAGELDLNEAATLVGMLPAPNAFNPVADPETAQGLRDRILNRMEMLGMITPQEANRARRSLIQVSPKARETLSQQIAPYFYGYVLQELEEILGPELAKEGNFIVETSLDVASQKQAEAKLQQTVKTQGATYGFSQGALVTLDSTTGKILALVGGENYQTSQFNRAFQAKRQPGSTFKLFAYVSALNQGISPYKTYSCGPMTWMGQQFRACERSSGNIDLYRAVAQSENAVALRVAEDVGLDSVITMAQDLGITTPLRRSPGLVLGESEVTVLEITGAYGAIANGGQWYQPHAISRIFDSSDCSDRQNYTSCRLMYDATARPDMTKTVLNATVANQMTDLLQGTVSSGTGRAANVPNISGEAGKTGTTNDNVDLWFIGYVPDRRVTGIWLGNDDNTPTRGSSGQAAALWGEYMKAIAN